MNVTRIVGTNVKGRNFEYELPTACVLHGLNYSGKSAVVVALRLGLAGYLPAPIGKLPSSIYGALAGDPDSPGVMEVELTVSTAPGRAPHSYSSRWTRNSAGKVSASGGVPAEYILPPVLIDPRTFFALSGPDRMKAIFDACDVKLDLGVISLTLNGCSPGAFPVPRRKAAIGFAIDRAKALLRVKSPQLAMSDLIDELKGKLKESKDALKTNTAIIQSLNWEGEMPEDVSVPMSESQAAQSKARQELAVARQKTDDHKKAKLAIATISESIRGLKLDIELATWDGEEPKQPDPSLLARHKELYNLAANGNYSLQFKRDTIRKNIQSVERNDGSCPTCGVATPGLADKFRDELAKLPAEENLDEAAEQIKELAGLQDRYVRLKANYDEATSNVASMKKKLEVMESIRSQMVPEPPSPEEVARLEAKLAKADMAVSLLHEASVKWETFQQTNQKREELERERVGLTCDETVYGDAVKELRDLMKGVVDLAFTKVLDYAQHFTVGILNSPLEYTTELGRRVSILDQKAGCKAPIGAWISHESFSGTEEAVAYAAFSVAIAMKSPFRLVIIDELGRMEQSTKALVLQRMNELVRSNKIDQFVGIDTVWTDLMPAIEVHA